MEPNTLNRLAEIHARHERQIGRSMGYREIAEATGTSKSTVTKWMRNKATTFDGKVLAAYCTFYGVTFNDMLVMVESAEPSS